MGGSNVEVVKRSAKRVYESDGSQPPVSTLICQKAWTEPKACHCRGEIETRDPRAVILAFLSRKPRPAQHGRDCEKSVNETAAVVTHCVFLLPLGGSSRRNKQDKEDRSALGLHNVVSQPFRGSVQYYCHLR